MRLGMITPLARKATSLIISLRLNLRNIGDDARWERVYGVEPEATPSTNNVILQRAAKPEMQAYRWLVVGLPLASGHSYSYAYR